MKRTGKPLLILVLLLSAWQAIANVGVVATIDRNRLTAGEAFTLQVKVSSEDMVPINPPSLPVIANVQMLHQWMSSETQSSVVSRGQGIDFKTITSKIYNYQFVTQSEGQVIIDPIAVEAGGRTYNTEAITIEVLPPGAAPPQAQAKPQFPRWGGRDPIDDLEDKFNALLQRQFGGVPGGGGFMTEPSNANEAFFILAEVDRTQAYEGEQITASWYLYTQGRVRDIDTLKYPDLKGFWKEDIQISTQLDFEQDVINGIPYSRALLASYALFPIDAGKANIDSYKAKATIVGGFFSGQGFQAQKASKEIPIVVKPLPTEGQPEDFLGAVGDFQMMVDPPKQPVVTHQPFSLKVRFEGRGNAKMIELPKLPIGKDLEVYDIKNESRFFKNGQSFKEFEVLLIPRQDGELVIGELSTSFFDPKKEQYVSLQSKPIRLTVLPGAKQESIGEERLQSDVVKKVLPPIAEQWNPDFRGTSSKLYIWLFALALVVLILSTKLVIDLGLFRKPPTLEDVIDSRFQTVNRLAAKKQFRKLGIETTNTVYQVLGEISGEGGSNQELDKVLAKVPPSVRREVEDPLMKLLDFFGILGFGPKSFVESYDNPKELQAKVKEMKGLLLKAASLSQGRDQLDNNA